MAKKDDKQNFSMSQQINIAAKHRVFWLKRSLRIIEHLGRNPVSEIFLFKAVNYLKQEQFDDVVFERNAEENCGYVFCTNPLPKASKQKYQICMRTSQVYDLEHAKNFCSSWCHRASELVKSQIEDTPVEDRTRKCITPLKLLHKDEPVDRLGAVNWDKLPANSDTHVSSKPKDKEQGDLSDSDRESETSSEDDSEVEEHVEKFTSNYCAPHNVPTSKMDITRAREHVSSKPVIPVKQVWPERGSGLPPAPKKMAFEYPLAAVTHHLTQWFTQNTSYFLVTASGEKVMKDLPESMAKGDQDMPSRKKAVAKRTGYKGLSEAVKDLSMEDTPVASGDETPVYLPLVDSVSQTSIRRKIVSEKLVNAMDIMLVKLEIPFRSISSELNKLIETFNLTSKNIVLKPAEWKWMAPVILKLLAMKLPEISAKVAPDCMVYSEILTAFECDWSALEDMCGSLVSEYLYNELD